MNLGWIKLHRKFIHWEWYDDPNTMRLFIHCLLKANHQDKRWRGQDIKRGTFITSLSNLSKELSLSVQQIRTSFDKLELTGEINKASTSLNTCVTVINYDDYQSDNKPSTNDQQTSNKRVTTTKNEKNVKNDNNISPLIENFESLKSMAEPLTEEQGVDLVSEYGETVVKETLMAMANWKGIEKKNKSTNLTCRNWIRRDQKNNKNSEFTPDYLKYD